MGAALCSCRRMLEHHAYHGARTAARPRSPGLGQARTETSGLAHWCGLALAVSCCAQLCRHRHHLPGPVFGLLREKGPSLKLSPSDVCQEAKCSVYVSRHFIRLLSFQFVRSLDSTAPG